MNEQPMNDSEPTAEQDTAPVIVPLDPALFGLIGGGSGIAILI